MEQMFVERQILTAALELVGFPCAGGETQRSAARGNTFDAM
jgi:hypothetical protein